MVVAQNIRLWISLMLIEHIVLGLRTAWKSIMNVECALFFD